MPSVDKEQIKNDLLDIAKESLDSYLDVMKEEGADAANKGKQFAKIAMMLTKDIVSGTITTKQYDDALENIKMSIESYLAAEGYRQSRKHLKILVGVLKKAARIAVSIIVAAI